VDVRGTGVRRRCGVRPDADVGMLHGVDPIVTTEDAPFLIGWCVRAQSGGSCTQRKIPHAFAGLTRPAGAGMPTNGD
jgi:hypothetical protein